MIVAAPGAGGHGELGKTQLQDGRGRGRGPRGGDGVAAGGELRPVGVGLLLNRVVADEAVQVVRRAFGVERGTIEQAERRVPQGSGSDGNSC